jgi:hypothetical protein
MALSSQSWRFFCSWVLSRRPYGSRVIAVFVFGHVTVGSGGEKFRISKLAISFTLIGLIGSNINKTAKLGNPIIAFCVGPML